MCMCDTRACMCARVGKCVRVCSRVCAYFVIRVYVRTCVSVTQATLAPIVLSLSEYNQQPRTILPSVDPVPQAGFPLSVWVESAFLFSTVYTRCIDRWAFSLNVDPLSKTYIVVYHYDVLISTHVSINVPWSRYLPTTYIGARVLFGLYVSTCTTSCGIYPFRVRNVYDLPPPPASFRSNRSSKHVYFVVNYIVVDHYNIGDREGQLFGVNPLQRFPNSPLEKKKKIRKRVRYYSRGLLVSVYKICKLCHRVTIFLPTCIVAFVHIYVTCASEKLNHW